MEVEEFEFFNLTVFDDEIANFFANVNIGSVVHGQFIMQIDDDGDQISVPDDTTLQPTNIPLNNILYFTMPQINGRPNPLYCIVTQTTLIDLFSLYVHYTNMRSTDRLSASNEMRRYLRQTMIKTIKLSAQLAILDIINDSQKKYKMTNHPFVLPTPNQINNPQPSFQLRLPTQFRLQSSTPSNVNNVQAIDQILSYVPILIQAIDNPIILANTSININGSELFNPNYFYHNFLYLIFAAKVKDLTKQELNSLQEPVRLVYENILPFSNNYISSVLQYQQDMTALAEAYKNKVRIEKARARVEERRRLRAQAAANNL